MRSDKWKNSITLYEDIIKKSPDNFLALNSLGVENMMKNNDDKAYLYFNRATNVAPNNYKGYYNRGLLLLKNNNPKKAIEEFNKVFSLYDYSKAYVARAFLAPGKMVLSPLLCRNRKIENANVK